MPDLTWPTTNRAHDDNVHALQFGVPYWQQRAYGNANLTCCSYCGSVSASDLYRLMADVEYTPPPWPQRCDHVEHETAADRGRCYINQLAASEQWVGLELSDMKYGWPHKLYINHPDTHSRAAKFYTVHIRDTENETRAAIVGLVRRLTGLVVDFPDGPKVHWRWVGTERRT